MLITAKKPDRENNKSSLSTKQNAKKENNRSAARIWGILSDDDRKAGFELILNSEDQMFLLKQSKAVAHFDPLYYTMSELTGEVRRLTQVTRSNIFWAALMNTTVSVLPSWFDKLSPKTGRSIRHDQIN